jgi:hypothetical protein
MPIVECIPYPQIQPAEQALMNAYPLPIQFQTREEIENLTHEQALEVLRAARRLLTLSLLGQEYHEHMLDDCGDYLTAAVDNFNHLYHAYWDNDAVDFHIRVKEWLLDKDNEGLGGSDGEIRLEILSQNLLEEIYDF